MGPTRIITRFIAPALFLLLVMTALHCGDDVTDPGGDPGGGNDTTGPDLDLTPPKTITGLSMTYSLDDRAAYLEWPAPQDDSADEAVRRYEIKFTYTDPFIWDLAIPATDPPTPSLPGETENYTIRYPLRGRTLYSAIRSVDEAGNKSSISNIALVRIPGYSVTGQCLNAMDGQPVEGLLVQVITGGIHQFLTDPDGRYEISNLAAGAGAINVSTGSAALSFHTFLQSFELTENMLRTEHMIPALATESPRFDNLLSFLKLITESFPPSTALRLWKTRPVKCHIPEFVNAFNVDYKFEALRAAQRWMDKSGRALFTFVDQPPDTGITVHYKTRSQMNYQIAITRHTLGDDKHPLHDDIDIALDIESSEDVYRIMMHELGHTLNLFHLNYPEFIMYRVGNLPPDIHNDEANVVKLLFSLPSVIDMADYDESTP